MDYELAEKTIVLFWDDKISFNDPDKIVKIALAMASGKSKTFKDVILVEDEEDLKNEIQKHEDNPNQLFLVLIHVNHKQKNKGIHQFRNSKALKFFPKLNYYFISGEPLSDIYVDIKEDEQVYTYSKYQSLLGKSLIPQTKSQMLGEEKIEKKELLKEGIFLSHSSKDKKIVKSFRDLILNKGLNCSLNRIKYTSFEGHGIPGGINIPEDLRSFLIKEMGLFIQFISKNYLESRVCINEEGAAWCLLDDIMFIPIIIPPSKSDDLSWIKSPNKGIKVNDSSSLTNIYLNRINFFPEANLTEFNDSVNEFISSI